MNPSMRPIVLGAVVAAGLAFLSAQADQLALGHERHHELDPGAPQLAQRGGVELEPLDVHGAGRALEVRDDRIVRRNVDDRRLEG